METVSFSFSFIRARDFIPASAARKKNMIYNLRHCTGRSRRKRAMYYSCTIFKELCRRRTERRTSERGQRDRGTRYTSLGRGCWLPRAPRRENLISNVSPERVLRACIYVIWHALSTCAPNSRAQLTNTSGWEFFATFAQQIREILYPFFTSFSQKVYISFMLIRHQFI